MFRFEPEFETGEEDRLRSNVRLWLRALLLIAAAAGFLAAGAAGQKPVAAPQKTTTSPHESAAAPKKTIAAPQTPVVPGVTQATGMTVEARSHQIVAHLNAVIQYYRSTMQPVQKAGQPNDVVYRDQATELSAQIATFAFQSAKAQAALMPSGSSGQAGGNGAASGVAPGTATQGISEQQKMQAVEVNVEKQIGDLKGREADLDKQIAAARPKELATLQAQKRQLQGSLDLENAMQDALDKIVGMAGATGGTGLMADIDRLQSSVPELQSKNKIVPPTLITIASARSSGVTSQGSVLFDLLSTRHALDGLVHENTKLHTQALNLRTPLSAMLRNLIQQGQKISLQAAEAIPVAAATASVKKGVAAAAAASSKANAPGGATPASASAATAGAQPNAPAASPNGPAPDIGAITTEFKALSAATVPLSQEIIVVEQSRENLTAWQASVDEEYGSIFHALLLRILVIVIALVLIIGGGEVWRRATNKYIQDIRRRRQFLVIRRVVIGFLSVIVVLFGFVTQFNSLATFAGFITAGIAVGLQTVLLSVAAYFFIIGRYGIKVGDRITISSVTGDVIDVGLVRFYMMELGGSGSALNPTGRVAVFSNAVLFQAGTPLYKQIPGTSFAWHELIVKLAEGANYKLICESVLKEVHEVYEEHRPRIEAQHKTVEDHMQIPITMPAVESRFQFVGGVFQLWVRFPVEIDRASEMDEKLTRALMDLFAKNAEVKSGVASTPVIQASVKG